MTSAFDERMSRVEISTPTLSLEYGQPSSRERDASKRLGIPIPIEIPRRTALTMVNKPLSGAVVSENKLASEIGTRILEQGGNAVDAAIASVIAVNTTSPYHSDLGGGGFAIIRSPNGTFESLNFRSYAPVRRYFLIPADALGQSYARILPECVDTTRWDSSRCSWTDERIGIASWEIREITMENTVQGVYIAFGRGSRDEGGSASCEIDQSLRLRVIGADHST